MRSSLEEQLDLFSVVNIPLTSRYAHRAITRDSCGARGFQTLARSATAFIGQQGEQPHNLKDIPLTVEI